MYQIKEYSQKDILYQEGEDAKYAYYIARGTLTVIPLLIPYLTL